MNQTSMLITIGIAVLCLLIGLLLLRRRITIGRKRKLQEGPLEVGKPYHVDNIQELEGLFKRQGKSATDAKNLTGVIQDIMDGKYKR
jgi:hypothetical protein